MTALNLVHAVQSHQPLQLVTDGVIVIPEMSVQGGYSFAVQLFNRGGAQYNLELAIGPDAWQLRQLMDNDDIFQFLGVFNQLRVTEVAPGGGTAQVWISYQGR